MDGFRLLTYRDAASEGAPVAGVLIDGHVHRAGRMLEGAGIDGTTTLSVLRAWDTARPILDAAAKAPPPGGQPLDDVKLDAPLLYPGTIYCAGANYWDHIREMGELIRKTTGSAPPTEKARDPWFFVKSSGSTVVAPGARVAIPGFTRMLDWEAEVALVIGRPAKNVSAAQAFDVVAGFTILNDLSARDYVKREGSVFIYDWIGQKCFDGSAPMGPWITPVSAIADPDDMSIKLWVNDQLKQDSNTRELIHDFREQIAYLSSRLTLQPGDVVATGTPAGVGMATGTFLNPGDVMRIEVGGCGVLENTCVAEA